MQCVCSTNVLNANRVLLLVFACMLTVTLTTFNTVNV